MSESKAYFLAGTTLATLGAMFVGVTIVSHPIAMFAIVCFCATASIVFGIYSSVCFFKSAVYAIVEAITG